MKTCVLAIDPGTTQTAWVLWDGESIIAHGITPNEDFIKYCRQRGPYSKAAIEMVASYGMAVGREVFETVYWIGRFVEALRHVPTRRVERKEIKMHLCGTVRAKDANIRQALIDKVGGPGTKKKPGTTYGISSHKWAALAVAIYDAEVPPLKQVK